MRYPIRRLSNDGFTWFASYGVRPTRLILAGQVQELLRQDWVRTAPSFRLRIQRGHNALCRSYRRDRRRKSAFSPPRG